jgi:hypothetical protein
MAKRSDTAAAPATPISNADDITPQRFVLTASLADLAREKRNAVQEFELTATSAAVGQRIVAEVRRVDLNSVDAILALPDTLTRQVLEMQQQVAKAQQDGVTNADGTLNEDVGLKALRMMQEAQDLYCVAGFVNPPLIQHESLRTRDDQIVVELIDPADRRRFFEWCTGQNAEARATAARFPDEPGANVAAGGSGGGDQPPAEPASAAA